MTAVRPQGEALKKPWLAPKALAAVFTVGLLVGVGLTVFLFVSSTHEQSTVSHDQATAEAARKKLQELGIPYSWDAFMTEVEDGNASVVTLFLDAGMSPNSAFPILGSPIIKAAEKGHAEIVQSLSSKGADVNVKDMWGRTALMEAANHGHLAVVKVLLNKGSYVNAKDAFGYSALSIAEARHHEEIVTVLKKAGARKLDTEASDV